MMRKCLYYNKTREVSGNPSLLPSRFPLGLALGNFFLIFLLVPPVRFGQGGPFNVLIQYGLNFVYTKKEDKVRFGLFQLQDIWVPSGGRSQHQ